jgi:type II secretory ATPase GspE/PulE/Tfp pilus assembly ATPase PilB-like protein
MNERLPINAKEVTLNRDLLNLMPPELMEELGAFVFGRNDNKVKIGAVNLNNKVLKQYAKERFNNKVEWYSITKEDLNAVLSNHSSNFESEILSLIDSAPSSNDNIIKIVDKTIQYAFFKEASDIHIEPNKKEAVVRFRIDGILQSVYAIPSNIYKAVVARFKILANLKIDEYRHPQDGRIEPENNPDTSLRVSTMPTLFGEKIVLRVLDDSTKSLSLSTLGFSQKQQKYILNNIEKPFGMIVVSGPTGSGKTTTLYALLQLLKKEGLNISTLEDPIESALPGVNQTQVNPNNGLTFASGLRSLLRQDPDIIMVGEIRDSETACMAANAAMTGHLVFTTIHTNDAPSSFTRLLEMQVEDFVVAGTVNLVIAQRLVRRVCPYCKKKAKLDKVVLEKIRERKDIVQTLDRKEKGLSKRLNNLEFFSGKGCEKCLGTGYKGRMGIFEIIEPNKQIKDAVLSRKSSEDIKVAAERQGFKDIISDGLEKVFSGETTFGEVLRTTKNNQ